ncbi:MAG: hypothetical protein HYV53_01360 [Parcubacteria group bacterium]|nr:hypothetical protein [Parcubacteria group bacterium]
MNQEYDGQEYDGFDVWFNAISAGLGGTTLLTAMAWLPGAIGSFLICLTVAIYELWKISKPASIVMMVLNILTILAWDWFYSMSKYGGFLWFLH